MSNPYCTLPGTGKIKDTYTQINTGFDSVKTDMDSKMPSAGGTIGALTVSGNSGPVFALKGGTADHVFMQLFAQASSQTTRSGYMGFSAAGLRTLYLANEFVNADLDLRTNGTGRVMANGNLIWHAGNSGASLATNGYQKLASGIILQWGTATITTEGDVTFPIAFPTANLHVFGQVETATATNNVGIGSYLKTGFHVWVNGSGAQTIHWLAIGY